MKGLNPQWEPPIPMFINHLHSAYLILLTLALLGVVAGLLYQFGVISWVLGAFGWAVRKSVLGGFRVWEALLSWADWQGIAVMVAGLVLAGHLAHAIDLDFITVLIALSLLGLGLVTCLAYMYLSFERYEVARGYKAVHNPLKGQQLAANVARYGERAGVMLLVVSAVGTLLGFVQLNYALYTWFGRSWYTFSGQDEEAVFLDFLAYALVHLLRVVDVLDLAQTRQYLSVSIIRPAYWPASTMLMAFKSFFTLVLLQQVFASVREGRLLAETVTDFWSPHASIHDRARVALPQFGPTALLPMLDSLRSLGPLTREQRDQIPLVFASIGPTAIPGLIRHADDLQESIRAVVAKGLGLLRAASAVGPLIRLAKDDSETVRTAAVEALGLTGEAVATSRERPVDGRTQQGRWHHRFGWLNRIPAARLVRRLPFRWVRRAEVALAIPLAEVVPLCVETLRKALMDESAVVRCEAVIGLGRIGRSAENAAADLARVLGEDSDDVRRRAAEALGLIQARDELTIPALITALTNPNPEVRVAVATALGAYGAAAADAVCELVPLLQDRDESVRTAAAEAVNRVGVLGEESTRLLVGGLSSGDNVVRAQAAEALGVIGEIAEDTAPSLVAALTDRNDHVRGKAAEALGKIGNGVAEIAVPGLVRLLRDEDNWVRALAAEALGQMGEAAEDAAPALLRSLRHANPLVRANAAEALGRVKADEARAALEVAARDEDPGVRAKAIRAVAGLGEPTPDTVAAVRVGLTDPDPLVRAVAIESVGGWPGVTVDPGVFLDLLNDGNDEVATRAIRLASSLASIDAVLPALRARLQGAPNALVQTASASALGRIGPAAAAAEPELAAAAREGDIDLRTAAMRALALIQPPAAAGVFAAGLRDPDPKIRMVASGGLMKLTALPDDAVQVVVESLRDPIEQVRANAAHLLSLLDPVPADAVPDLIEAAETGGDGLRLNAATALRRVPEAQARAALRRRLADSNGRVRLVAAGSLAADTPDDPEIRAVLAAALDDDHPNIQVIANELIGGLGLTRNDFFPAQGIATPETPEPSPETIHNEATLPTPVE